MEPKLPHVIENHLGEKLVFKALVPEPDGDRLLLENFVAPGQGPVMHTHHQQDECLTVVHGTIGYQVLGGTEQFAGPGDTVLFERGVAHRFWNAGDSELHCTGWVKPANTLVFFLSSIYAAQHKARSHRPEAFDAAYLMTRYKSEYAIHGMPPFVRTVIVPLTYQVGRLLGKYRKFRDAPAPLRPA